MDYSQQIIFLSVSDLERSHTFYAHVLGLDLVRDQGRCRIYHTVGKAYVGICLSPDHSDSAGSLLTLVIDDVDGVYARCVKHGVATEHPPRNNPDYGIYHFYLRDPDGHRLEVQRFDHPL